MKRQQSLRVVQHDEELLPRIQALKAEYPFQGHLRILAYWRSIERWPVQKKRIWRLMWEHHLLVPPNLRQEAKPTPQGGKRKPSKRNQWWGIDMTKRLVGGVGWASIVIVLEWVYKGGREPLGWPAMHGHAMAGRAGHGGQPFVATRQMGSIAGY